MVYIPDHVDAHGAQSGERHIGRNIAELRTQQSLHRLLHISQSLSINQHGPDLGQRNAPFVIDGANQALGNAPPEIDGETIAWPHDVIRGGWKINRDRSRRWSRVLKYLLAK